MVFSQEYKDKMSNIIKEKWKTHPMGMSEKHFSDDSKKKLALIWKGKKRPEHSNFMSGINHPLYGKKRSKEWCENHNKQMKGKKYSKELYPNIGLRKLWKNDESKQMLINKIKEQFIINPNYGFKNKHHTEETIKKIVIAQKKRPNNLEKKYIEIIKKYNLPYKYVGDGSFFIGCKNPDFVNVNGKKICIEIFHDYWKIKSFGSVNNYIKNRTNHFAKYGWESIFIEDNYNKKEKEIMGVFKNV